MHASLRILGMSSAILAILLSPVEVRAQTCAQLQAQITALQRTLQSLNQSLTACQHPPQSCTATEIQALDEAIAATNQSIQIDMNALRFCGSSPSRPSNIKLVDMIPLSLSGESNQDSEPFLAVQRGNPEIMVGSAFTPNPFSQITCHGPGCGLGSKNEVIYVSLDGGNTWSLNPIVPITPGNGMACDQTYAMAVNPNDLQGDLHSGELGCDITNASVPITLDESETNDVTAAVTMSVQSSRQQVDQPFTQAFTTANDERVYVGINDWNLLNGKTATVDVSLNGGTNFKSWPIEKRPTDPNCGGDGPSIRPAVALDGTVYAAFFGWRSPLNNTLCNPFIPFLESADVVVVRDDEGAAGPSPFQSLTDPSDGLAGRIVVKGIQIPWSNGPGLGQERTGSTLSLAVDPNNSSSVYIGWADLVKETVARLGVPSSAYTLHVRHSPDRGVTWSGTDLRFMTMANATNIALAVADNGVLGVLYQQFATEPEGNRWITHLMQANSYTMIDHILANVPADSPALAFWPYLGDYAHLLAVGGEFRGVFSANNTPDLGNFPQVVKFQRAADFNTKTLNDGSGNSVPISIDPFYFSVPVINQ